MKTNSRATMAHAPFSGCTEFTAFPFAVAC
jgi:hypothetical protein